MDKCEHIKWIDGIRGGACIVVLIGHSLACIFPAMYFGASYRAHNDFEYMFHSSPFNILADASAMVTIFFLLGGFLLTTNFYKRKRTYIAVILNRYIRYLPMVFLGILIGYFVMVTNCVNSIRLERLSFAGQYVSNYNNFTPTIMGKDGILLESFVKVFLVGSDYNTVLWFISIEFIGTLFCEGLMRIVNIKKVQFFCFLCLFVMCSLAGIGVWKLQYMGCMFLGCAVGVAHEQRKCKHGEILFILGTIVLTIPQQSPAGIYHIFSYVPNLIVPLWGIGSLAVFEGIKSSRGLQNVFETKIIQNIGKISYEIYTLQWPIIISLSCGITIVFASIIDYWIAGVIGFMGGCVFTIIISIFVHETWYKFLYENMKSLARKAKLL
jgi:Predicted acyltransferases